MGLGLSGLRLGLGRRGGGSSVSVPVLSNFTDNLDQDPPNALFDSSEAGTLTWDFDASVTPPAKGAGSIGTGTDSVTSGANDINIDLSAYPGETGYLHLRVANAAGDSNVLTSQEITIPDAGVGGYLPQGGMTSTTGFTVYEGTTLGGISSWSVTGGQLSYTLDGTNGHKGVYGTPTPNPIPASTPLTISYELISTTGTKAQLFLYENTDGTGGFTSISGNLSGATTNTVNVTPTHPVRAVAFKHGALGTFTDVWGPCTITDTP